MQPTDPVMRALAWLIFNYGTEGLFLQCQHYRWSFKDSADFAAMDIGRALASPDPKDAKKIEQGGADYEAMKLGRFPDQVGITAETIPSIEKSTASLFEKLDLHFRYFPYVLGGRPSVADCALMEVLHAHLGRDIHPADIMKKTAPVLYRWTETMNRPGIQDAELSQVPKEFLTADKLPNSLIDLLRMICMDFGAQFEATAKAYEDWLASEPDRAEGAIIASGDAAINRQAMGKMEYKLQGVKVRRDAWPDVINMHQYVLEVVDAMQEPELARWNEIMELVGGDVFLKYRPSRSVVIKKDQPPYGYVLGPKTA